MAFRFRNFAPLGPEEGLNGWLHKAAGWQRRLFGLSGDRYVRSLIQGGHSVGTVGAVDASPVVCHICGYQMAAITNHDGWTIEACSHSMARKMFNNARFDSWRNDLPALAEAEPCESASASEPRSPVATHLQTSTH